MGGKVWLISVLVIGWWQLAYCLTLFDWTIVVESNSPGKVLIADCKSNGAEIIPRLTVQPLATVLIDTPVLVKERSWVTCSFTMPDLHATFDLFDYDRDKTRCSSYVCYWKIDETGFFMRVSGDYTRLYTWS